MINDYNTAFNFIEIPWCELPFSPVNIFEKCSRGRRINYHVLCVYFNRKLLCVCV